MKHKHLLSRVVLVHNLVS